VPGHLQAKNAASQQKLEHKEGGGGWKGREGEVMLELVFERPLTGSGNITGKRKIAKPEKVLRGGQLILGPWKNQVHYIVVKKTRRN